MTLSVSHTAPRCASADNRPLTDYVSCTQMLRHAHHMTDGDLTKALDVLRALSDRYSNAWSAVRVLRQKMRKHPGSDIFTIERSGFVRLSKRPARAVFALVVGDLRFERSGDSMAVFRHDERIDRVDLPMASEFAFFRAAHDYSAALAPAEVA